VRSTSVIQKIDLCDSNIEQKCQQNTHIEVKREVIVIIMVTYTIDLL